METIIADIVREMRKDIPRVIDAKVILRNYADRIEEAHKREQEDAIAATVIAAAKSASEVYEPHIYPESVGNAAALREAAKATMKFLESAIVNGKISVEDLSTLQNIVSKALSDPPRNCDVGTAGEQEERYIKLKREHVDRMLRCPAEGQSFFPDSLYWAQMPYKEKEGTK